MSIEHTRHEPIIDRTDITTDYGVYRFDDDNITIVSQPSVDKMLEVIGEQPALGTTILTPEFSMLDNDDLDDFVSRGQRRQDAMSRVAERFLQLKHLSETSDNTILVGAPLRVPTGVGYGNGLVAVERGNVVHTQHKVYPGMYERSLGAFEYSNTREPNRFQQMGRIALICSELIFAQKITPHEKVYTDTVMMPAAWGTPSMTPEAIARHGGPDGYNAHTLAVATRMASEQLPNLRKIYIADRPMGQGNPQNGRLKIRRD